MYLWHLPLNCVRDCEIRKSKYLADFIVEHLLEKQNRRRTRRRIKQSRWFSWLKRPNWSIFLSSTRKERIYFSLAKNIRNERATINVYYYLSHERGDVFFAFCRFNQPSSDIEHNKMTVFWMHLTFFFFSAFPAFNCEPTTATKKRISLRWAHMRMIFMSVFDSHSSPSIEAMLLLPTPTASFTITCADAWLGPAVPYALTWLRCRQSRKKQFIANILCLRQNQPESRLWLSDWAHTPHRTPPPIIKYMASIVI